MVLSYDVLELYTASFLLAFGIYLVLWVWRVFIGSDW